MKLLTLVYFFLVNIACSFQKVQSVFQQSAMGKVTVSRIRGDSAKPMALVIKCLTKEKENFVIIEKWNIERSFMFKSNIIPVYLFDVKQNIYGKFKRFPYFAVTDEIIAKAKVYPMSNFVIIISPITVLTSLLTELRQSIWWNNEAHFLIYNSDFINPCKFARHYLRIAWNFNILSAVYLCWNEQDKLTAYTFNPYDRVGTAFWKIVPDESNKDDFWTLLQHSFENSSNLEDMNSCCKDLSFDRTKNLNLLNVRVGSDNIDLVLFNNRKIEVYNDLKLIGTLLNELNASYTYKNFSEFGLITEKGPTSYLKEIESGSIQMVTVCSVMRFNWRIQTYPHEYHEILVVTPKEIINILRVMFTSGVITLPIVSCSISVIFFTLLFSKSIGSSLLEYLRMQANEPVLTSVQRTYHRVILINLIFLIFLTNTYLQCFISTNSTVQKYKPMMDSIEDLLNSKLTLYAAPYHEEYIYPEELSKQFVPSDPVKCIKEANSGKKIACAVHHEDLAFENTDNVHIAEYSMAVRPSTFTVTPNWPLLAKLNRLLHFTVESGIYQRLSVHTSALKFSKGNKKKEDEYSAVSMSQLSLYFHVFFGGCGVAICSFLIEVVVCRFFNW